MTSEKGSAAILMLAVVAMLAAIAVATTGLGMVYAARAQAQNAADASALAAAVATYPPAAGHGPLSAAHRAADANGALLAGCRCEVDLSLRPRVATVAVTVPIHVPILGELDVRMSSRAEFDPLRWLGG